MRKASLKGTVTLINIGQLTKVLVFEVVKLLIGQCRTIQILMENIFICCNTNIHVNSLDKTVE
jgi:hypothetical protein